MEIESKKMDMLMIQSIEHKNDEWKLRVKAQIKSIENVPKGGFCIILLLMSKCLISGP
jgi:hypothetical protein